MIESIFYTSQTGSAISANVQYEARLTGSVLSMQDRGWNFGESFELGAGQPLLSMRLFGVVATGRLGKRSRDLRQW